jgi:osmoprotectant transport system ATP-binding protein
VITFTSVTKRFPDGTVAVDDLSLELPEGKITVFVGPSGCGKTTSLRMINRMVEPTSGQILVDGRSVLDQDPALLRRRMGYVIQQAGLLPHRTIVDNIATVPYLLGWDKKKARSTALELLERVGLPASYANRYPVQLSGGQQQRVGVARALAADPPIMLMDEPFSAVDPIVRAQLQAEFLRLQGELGKTIAFVTHDIDEAVKLGDLVAVFAQGGHLAQVDTPERLWRRRRATSLPTSSGATAASEGCPSGRPLTCRCSRCRVRASVGRAGLWCWTPEGGPRGGVATTPPAPRRPSRAPAAPSPPPTRCASFSTWC